MGDAQACSSFFFCVVSESSAFAAHAHPTPVALEAEATLGRGDGKRTFRVSRILDGF
jgi:hypothetical protein